jgi:branched-chain amino acid transport system permease protein
LPLYDDHHYFPGFQKQEELKRLEPREALSGVLGGAATANISYHLGEGLLLKGFAAVVVGGFNDVRGTIIAGIMLGIAEVFISQYLSSTYRDGVTYVLLLGFLFLRPRGLFGSGNFIRA